MKKCTEGKGHRTLSKFQYKIFDKENMGITDRVPSISYVKITCLPS